MKTPLTLPTETAAIEQAVAARADEILPTVEAYEKDLISLVMDHAGLAAQFALVVAVPVALIAFQIGRHFH